MGLQTEDVPMSRTASEERDYFLRRSADHRDLAARTAEAGNRVLHEQFATLYAERAASVMVDDH
ncbi:MAG TPA: hypothetical protein DEP91_11425 [Sphingomonas bacterium]|uniref:Uncharacterized protein n=1 Tax=Sphingomonas bacterium TaxID=1895847 RepID=A0A3D0WDF6_9SPHN|nr:hypothetical protein [Sphingomonas bacterium]